MLDQVTVKEIERLNKFALYTWVLGKLREIIYYFVVFLPLMLTALTIDYIYQNYRTELRITNIIAMGCIYSIAFILFFFIFQVSRHKIAHRPTRIVNIILFSLSFAGGIIYIYQQRFTRYSLVLLALVLGYSLLFLIELYFLKLKSFWHLAVHESAHTVVSEIEFPGSVIDITIFKRNNGYSGYTYTKIDTENKREKYLRQMRVFLAGGIAEKLFLADDIKDKPTGDIEFIIETIKEIVNNGHCKNINTAWDDLPKHQQELIYSKFVNEESKVTQQILKDNISNIMKLALRLYKSKKMEGNQAREIINNKLYCCN